MWAHDLGSALFTIVKASGAHPESFPEGPETFQEASWNPCRKLSGRFPGRAPEAPGVHPKSFPEGPGTVWKASRNYCRRLSGRSPEAPGVHPESFPEAFQTVPAFQKARERSGKLPGSFPDRSRASRKLSRRSFPDLLESLNGLESF